MTTPAWSFESPNDGVYKDRIDWGVMMDLSGPAAGNEVPWTRGVQAYFRKVNEAGGIHGRKINLLIEDDHYDTATVRANYERLVSQTNVLAISGMGSSTAQAAMMPMIKSVIMTVSPPGHEHYVEELARLASAGALHDAQALGDLRSRYDTDQLSALEAAD